MTVGMLAAMFLFVLAAVTAAGYVFVLRPSRPETSDAQLPSSLTMTAPNLPSAQAVVADALRLIGEAVPQKKNQNEIRRDLVAAGYRYESAVSVFMGIKTATALLLGTVVSWIGVASKGDVSSGLLGAVCGMGFGYLLPDRILTRFVQHRVAKLRRALPPALDLMVLAIEAGQALDSAILETSRGLRLSHPELASEFTQLQLELKANTTRGEALRNFSTRTQDMEMRKFANLLMDTDRFGTSLGPALKTHARYLRIRFRQMAQEKARKVGVKLIFPIFFLIFPSVMLVTLGPAAIMLTTQLKNLIP
ncbi:MAG: type II secretion system F family protein [Bryobacteraceae bacterium]